MLLFHIFCFDIGNSRSGFTLPMTTGRTRKRTHDRPIQIHFVPFGCTTQSFTTYVIPNTYVLCRVNWTSVNGMVPLYSGTTIELSTSQDTAC